MQKPGRWTPGQSGNPNGRPLASRQKISERLLADLAEVWEEHGKVVLTKLAVSDPGKLATIAYGLLPRDVFVQVQTSGPGNIDANAWGKMRKVLDLIERVCPADTDPAAVFEEIEHALRSAFAKERWRPYRKPLPKCEVARIDFVDETPIR